MAERNSAGSVRLLGLLVIIAGAILLVAGVATYVVVSTTLSDQQITVSDDAAAFAGEHVDQPWEAYAQADIIGEHASEIADGQTYAELPQDDPNRQTVMDASFLQASLFTSVVAFGVAAMAAGLGIVFLLIGFALRSLGRATAAAPVAAVAADRGADRPTRSDTRSEPAPSDPVRSEPAPSEPARTEPAPSEPARTERRTSPEA